MEQAVAFWLVSLLVVLGTVLVSVFIAGLTIEVAILVRRSWRAWKEDAQAREGEG